MKRLFKKACNAAAVAAGAPLGLICRLLMRAGGGDAVFHDFSQLFSLFPGTSGDYLRKGFYYWTLARCSLDAKICFGVLIAHSRTEIHDGAYIGPYCLIGTARIGAFATLGSGVHILSGKQQHSFDRLDIPIQRQAGRFELVDVGADCWIGNGSIVMADIGEQAIVGAGSVVAHSVEARAVVAGNPARALRTRTDSAGRERTEKAPANSCA
jgi:acetyltransferase-like isoleucine patch superfamily enzyme